MALRHEDYVIDANSPEEATAIAMERYLKQHPEANFQRVRVVCVEEAAEN